MNQSSNDNTTVYPYHIVSLDKQLCCTVDIIIIMLFYFCTNLEIEILTLSLLHQNVSKVIV